MGHTGGHRAQRACANARSDALHRCMHTHANPLPTTPAPGNRGCMHPEGSTCGGLAAPAQGSGQSCKTTLDKITLGSGAYRALPLSIVTGGMLHVSGSAAPVKVKQSNRSKVKQRLACGGCKATVNDAMQLSSVAKTARAGCREPRPLQKKEWEVHAACCNKCCGCRNPLGAAREKVPSIPHKPPPPTQPAKLRLAVHQAHEC